MLLSGSSAGALGKGLHWARVPEGRFTVSVNNAECAYRHLRCREEQPQGEGAMAHEKSQVLGWNLGGDVYRHHPARVS